MFSFAQETLISIIDRNITFLYRETSVQHFNEPGGVFNINKAKQWQSGKLARPLCRSNEDPDKADWRYKAEQKALRQFQFNFKNIIMFRELSKHFWDVHAASPYFRGSYLHVKQRRHGGRDEDCTHFIPTAAPLLYRVLWHQILSH